MAKDTWDARTFKVGDILDASFQYTMKIPEFFIVTRNTGKTVYARKLGKVVVSHDGYGQSGTMVPNLAERSEKEYVARIRKDGSIKLEGCFAYLWDGEPVDFWGD